MAQVESSHDPLYRDTPINDLRNHSLTKAEKLSLKHFIAWVDSHGTVKAYALHAKVLQEETGTEILSLYMARKLALKFPGLSSQLVDMCPKSCMAYTGEFKDLVTSQQDVLCST